MLPDAITHDSELARHLHISHQHLGVDGFEASLGDPRTGTQVLRTSDELERLMLDEQSDALAAARQPPSSRQQSANRC